RSTAYPAARASAVQAASQARPSPGGYGSGPPVRLSVLSRNAIPANVGSRSETSSATGAPVMTSSSGSPSVAMNSTASAPAEPRSAAPAPHRQHPDQRVEDAQAQQVGRGLGGREPGRGPEHRGEQHQVGGQGGGRARQHGGGEQQRRHHERLGREHPAA